MFPTIRTKGRSVHASHAHLGVNPTPTGRRTEIYGTPFASDVGCLVNEAGVEAITFGPGSVADCHCSDERVEVEQLVQAAATVADVATQLLT